jgi:hypothetical protein
MTTLNCIEDIKHILYINLESRPDRKQHFEKQMSILGLHAERFNAIKMSNGAIGCSLSHLKCIEVAKKNNWDHVLIMEDDIKFLEPDLFKQQFNKFLKNHEGFDVCLIAGNNVPPYEKIDDSCVKVSACQTTTGYLVKSHYYDTLIENYKFGIEHLMREPENRVLYAIDKNWFTLQRKDNWFLIVPLTVTQRADYSDIEKRPTDYSLAMRDLDKKWLKNKTDIQPKSKMNMTFA